MPRSTTRPFAIGTSISKGASRSTYAFRRATSNGVCSNYVCDLKKGDKIEPLMAELSEDPGSAKDGKDYEVSADSPFVPPFKNLSLRLKVGEVGVVKSDFGLHIIKRTE